MIVAIDMGNSRIKFGVKTNDSVEYFSEQTRPIRDVRSYIAKDGFRGNIDGVIISSVVKELSEPFISYFKNEYDLSPIVVDHATDTGLIYSVNTPETIGPDRIANAVGGYAICNGPAIIVDFGTATTITVVGKGGVFLGGTIMPGVETMARSLNEKTSRLPLVDIAMPSSTIGGNTIENIQAGIIVGTAGAVDRLVDEIRTEIGYTISVVLTGGTCKFFRDMIRTAHIVDPLLTMKGLFLIFERQQS